MKAISRKGWTPNSLSNSSRICGKHFLKTDYKQRGVKARLLDSAVPSVFPSYPKYMQPPCKKMCSTSAIEKRGFSSPNISGNSCSVCLPTIPFDVEENVSVSIFVDKAVQVDVIRTKTMSDINKHKLRASHCLDKVQKLQQELDNCKRELYMLQDDCFISEIKRVIKDAEENNPTAVLIRDIIENYTKKRPKYSDMTIRHAIIWRSISTKGYEYGRKDIGLPLPSRSTL